VQVLTGLVDADGSLQNPVVIPMRLAEKESSGTYLFQAVIQPTARSGLHGYAIRMLPNHPDSFSPYLPGLIKWATGVSPVAELQAR
jgi:starch phosphorylase